MKNRINLFSEAEYAAQIYPAAKPAAPPVYCDVVWDKSASPCFTRRTENVLKKAVGPVVAQKVPKQFADMYIELLWLPVAAMVGNIPNSELQKNLDKLGAAMQMMITSITN